MKESVNLLLVHYNITIATSKHGTICISFPILIVIVVEFVLIISYLYDIT